MSLELTEIQKSVRNKLIANSNLIAILANGSNSILDNPQNTNNNDYPLIGFTDQRSEPFDTTSTEGNTVFIVLTAYTQTGSRLQAQAILKEFNTSLHQVDLSVNNLVYCRSIIEFSEIVVDDPTVADGFNAIIRLRLTTY